MVANSDFLGRRCTIAAVSNLQFGKPSQPCEGYLWGKVDSTQREVRLLNVHLEILFPSYKTHFFL